MSKKDYKLIARAIQATKNNGGGDDIQRVAVMIATVLKADNEKFQYTKFLEACGYPVE